MLSNRYVFRSNELQYKYANGFISHQTYLSFLEDIKLEELASIIFDGKKRKMAEEIYSFESQQIKEAEQKLQHHEKPKETLRSRFDTSQQRELLKKSKEQEQKMQPQTLEQKRISARRDFYEMDSLQLLNEYIADAKKYRSKHDRMQITVIVCSALATSTTGSTIFIGASNLSITLKILATAFSLMVSIASGSMAYRKYKERSNDTQKTADTIEDDRNAFLLGIGDYQGKSLEDALSIFAERTHKTVSEYKKKQQLLDQPPEAKINQPGQ
jgi:hypothetical protein